MNEFWKNIINGSIGIIFGIYFFSMVRWNMKSYGRRLKWQYSLVYRLLGRKNYEDALNRRVVRDEKIARIAMQIGGIIFVIFGLYFLVKALWRS